MDFKLVELKYSKKISNSELVNEKIQLDIRFKNMEKNPKGTNILIEQTDSIIKSVSLYDNGLIIYSEVTADYSLVKTNKPIEKDNEGLFIEI